MLLAATLTERKTTNVGLYSNNEVLMIENDYSLPYEKLPAELAEHPRSPIRSPWRRAEGMFPMDQGGRAEARFRRSRRTAAPLRTVDSENQANNSCFIGGETRIIIAVQPWRRHRGRRHRRRVQGC